MVPHLLVGKNTTAEHAGLHQAEEMGRKGWNKQVCPVFQGGPGSCRKLCSPFRAENERFSSFAGRHMWIWTGSQPQSEKCWCHLSLGHLVSPWPGLPWRQSPALMWNTLLCPEHEQTVKPERETELCVPHQLGHLKPKQPENELKKLKRDHGNETHPVPLYKHSDCSNASRRMETVIFLIL